MVSVKNGFVCSFYLHFQSFTGIEAIDDDEVDLLKENITPRKTAPTLLKRLTERQPETLDYLGTSFGLTNDLLRFWKSQKFVPVYLR
jgi:N-acetyltransferase 10